MREVASAVSNRRDDLLKMTRGLVAAASPNPPGDTRASALVAATFLSAIDGVSEVHHFETEPGIVNLVATVRGGEPGKRLVFSGHLDTFPIGEHLVWSVPPTSGVCRDGRIYGRGVADMKGGIAASILAAAMLSEYRSHWNGEIVVALAGDEETMGRQGADWLLENIPEARGDGMICGDVGSPRVARFGEKGLLWIEVEAVGVQGHGAHVHRGINAIDRLRLALDALKGLETVCVDPPPGLIEAIQQAEPISELLGDPGEAEILRRITVSIGTIAGGVSPNLIPDRARAAVDIRLPAGLTLAAARIHVDEALRPIPGISWKQTQGYSPTYTDPRHPLVETVLNAGELVTGARPATNMRIGASDARLYRMRGIPSVVIGCTPFNMGAADEYVLVDELVAVAQIHAVAGLNYLSRVRS